MTEPQLGRARPRTVLWHGAAGSWRVTPPAPRNRARRDDRRSRPAILQRPDHLAPHQRMAGKRAEATSAQPGRRRAGHRPATTGLRAIPHPSLAVAGSRRSERPGRAGPGTAPSRPRLRGAPARPTPLDAAPAPVAPAAAAPCGPARQVCQLGSSKARRVPPARRARTLKPAARHVQRNRRVAAAAGPPPSPAAGARRRMARRAPPLQPRQAITQGRLPHRSGCAGHTAGAARKPGCTGAAK